MNLSDQTIWKMINIKTLMVTEWLFNLYLLVYYNARTWNIDLNSDWQFVNNVINLFELFVHAHYSSTLYLFKVSLNNELLALIVCLTLSSFP